MAAQWRSAASLDRSIGRCRSLHPQLPPPCQASVPAASPSRWTRRKGRIGCVSVRAAAEAERTARPEVEADTEEEGVVCEGCSGTGWLLCGFCKGKKNNVKSESSRVYRRCPTCKAAGYILCPRCRVYRCITFPASDDS